MERAFVPHALLRHLNSGSPHAPRFFLARGESSLAPRFPSSTAPASSKWPKPSSGALAERRHLIVEAGTGTGKTLAYLLPALRTGQRVIVSTGTKASRISFSFAMFLFLKPSSGSFASAT
ncbi:MAG: DEAD/DEAH box helicase [Terracidiphilus sp.]